MHFVMRMLCIQKNVLEFDIFGLFQHYSLPRLFACDYVESEQTLIT